MAGLYPRHASDSAKTVNLMQGQNSFLRQEKSTGSSVTPEQRNWCFALSLVMFGLSSAFIIGLLEGWASTYFVAIFFCAILAFLIVADYEPLIGPLKLTLLAYLLEFGIRALVICFDPSSSAIPLLIWNADKWRYLDISLLYTLLWVFVLIMAYKSRFAARLASRLSTVSLLNRPWSGGVYLKAYLIYLLGMVGRIYLIISGQFIGIVQARAYYESFTYTLGSTPARIILGTVLPQFSHCGFILLSILYLGKRKNGHFFAFGLILLVEVFFAYIESTKGAFINIVVVVLVCLYLNHGKAFRFSAVMVPVGLALIFPVVESYRYYVSLLGLSSGFQFDPALFVEQLSLSLSLLPDLVLARFCNLPDLLVKGISSRFMGVDIFAATLISQGEMSEPFVWGQTLLASVVNALPRIAWSSRPTLNIGYWFVVNYLGGASDAASVTSPPRIVEFYLNFGFIGIVLGSVVMGVLLRAIKRILQIGSRSSLFVYIFLVLNVVLSIDKPIAPLLALWKDLLLMAGIMLYLSWSGRTGASTHTH